MYVTDPLEPIQQKSQLQLDLGDALQMPHVSLFSSPIIYKWDWGQNSMKLTQGEIHQRSCNSSFASQLIFRFMKTGDNRDVSDATVGKFYSIIDEIQRRCTKLAINFDGKYHVSLPHFPQALDSTSTSLLKTLTEFSHIFCLHPTMTEAHPNAFELIDNMRYKHIFKNTSIDGIKLITYC